MALDVIGGFDGLCRTGRHDQTSMFIARRCIARLSCHHPRRHVWPQVFGLDLGIWLRISDAPMTWTCEVRIGKEPANTVEAIGIVAEAGERQQELFYRALENWATDANQPYFYFSAFDEKWKGGGATNEVEKNWGVFNSDRTPKLVMQENQK